MAMLRLLLLVLVCVSGPVQAGLVVLRTASQEGLRAKFDIGSRERPGVCIEIMQALQRLDPELHFTGIADSMSTARVEKELETGRLDVFFGFLKTPERLRRFQFADPPLFMQSSRVAVRSDDPVRVMSFDDIRALGLNGVILATQGTAHVSFLNKQGGLIVDDGARTSDANLRKLVMGRGRFYYQGDLNLGFDIQAYGYAGRVRMLPVTFNHEGQYVVFSRRVSAVVVARVARGLQELERRGELQAIYRRYAP